MSIWESITSNYVVNAGFLSFFSAQLIKTALFFIATRTLNWERMVGAGGMPSSHSAMTSSIAIAVARKMGFSSPEFGIALAFAAIVMYDAMGVRRAAGEQAKVLNKMMFEFSNFPNFLRIEKGEERSPQPGKEPRHLEKEPQHLEKELKEYLGHTPFEVLAGSLLGILISIFLPVK